MNKMSMLQRLTAFCCSVAVALSLCAAPSGAFTAARAPYRFIFPRDHGAHDDYQSEWWYYTGHLLTPAGRRFGFEVTFFRIALSTANVPSGRTVSGWRGDQLYPAHFAITDDQGKRFVYDERLVRPALGMAGATTGHLAVHAGGWTLAQRADGAFVLAAEAGGNALHLVLTSRKPPAIHGAGGITRKGSCGACASHYYSMTRLEARGSLAYSGVTSTVAGTAWMDHEYASSSLEAGLVGWDWFAIMLADGREIMIYRLRNASGKVNPESSGSLVDRSGHVVALDRDDVMIDVMKTWRSPHTQGLYPAQWHLRIPRYKIDLLLTPRVDDQELAPAGGTSPAYWEGDTAVTTPAGAPAGDAYVELTGYAGKIQP